VHSHSGLLHARIDELVTPEAVCGRWGMVADMSALVHLESIQETIWYADDHTGTDEGRL
jgi:hypothetical protein